MFHKDLYGLRLKKLRNLSGERQADLAAVLGVKPNQIMEKIKRAVEIIKSFCLAGVQNTMNQYNNK